MLGYLKGLKIQSVVGGEYKLGNVGNERLSVAIGGAGDSRGELQVLFICHVIPRGMLRLQLLLSSSSSSRRDSRSCTLEYVYLRERQANIAKRGARLARISV